MAGQWHSEEDFEEDFWSMAEIPMTTSQQAKTPVVSDHLRAARNTQRLINSIYFDPDLNKSYSDKEDDDGEEENIKYHRFPSRGRHLKSNIRRPGGKISDNEFYKLVQLDIRQVAGPGYSNELIEHAFKVRDNDEETSKRKVYFQPATNQSSRSGSSAASPLSHEELHKNVKTKDKHFTPLKKKVKTKA